MEQKVTETGKHVVMLMIAEKRHYMKLVCGEKNSVTWTDKIKEATVFDSYKHARMAIYENFAEEEKCTVIGLAKRHTQSHQSI